MSSKLVKISFWKTNISHKSFLNQVFIKIDFDLVNQFTNWFIQCYFKTMSKLIMSKGFCENSIELFHKSIHVKAFKNISNKKLANLT